MIKRCYSAKHKRMMWGYDARLSDGRGGTKRFRIYEFSTRDEAERVLNAIRTREREERFGIAPLITRPTLHDLIEKRIPIIAMKAERTRARRILYTWLSLLDSKVKLDRKHQPNNDYRSPLKVDKITTATVRVYVERRQQDKVSAASINRELATIAATLNQAGEIFPELEQWKTPKMPRLKVTKSRREHIITNDEYRRLIAHLRRPPDELDPVPRRRRWEDPYQSRVRVAQIFEFAMMSAARHGEIAALKWADISWSRGKVLVYQGKTGEYKEIPLTSAMTALINERKPETGLYVFTPKGKIYMKFYEILRAACEHLGIPYGRWIENGLLLHTARHTVTTHLVEKGLDFDTISLITGHRAKELIAHYSHKHPASVARAAAALEQMAAEREE